MAPDSPLPCQPAGGVVSTRQPTDPTKHGGTMITTDGVLRLEDLLPTADLAEAIEAGYVREQFHPTEPLRILNYTEQAIWERAWTPVTLTCRGLIVNTQTGQVVARPWAEFFNYGEHPEGSLDLTAPAEVTDKLDGSLGILYPVPDGWAVATRGSFTSDQARHATAVLRSQYPDFLPPEGMTCLFEIVYPANRVVLDYGAMDDLILLGAVDIATGEAVGPDWVSLWDGPLAETFGARTLAAALALPPRANAEGVDQHIRNQYDIRMVIDDRKQVVDMWRSLGLTCLAVADGDF